MDPLDRVYERKSITQDNITISYLFSKGSSNKLILAFPQGFREAQHFVDHFKIFDGYWNVLVIDPLGRGESTKSNNQEDYLKSFDLYLETITTEGFDFSNTIVLGKSFSAPYVEYLLRQKDEFYYSIIITGPRLLSRIKYSAARLGIYGALKSWLIRDAFNAFIHFYAKHSTVDVKYYNWKESNGWLQWKIPLIIRNHSITPQIKTPTFLIYNKRDELVPNKKVKEAQKIFENSEVYYLNSFTHWGPIPQELIEVLTQKLKLLEQVNS